MTRHVTHRSRWLAIALFVAVLPACQRSEISSAVPTTVVSPTPVVSSSTTTTTPPSTSSTTSAAVTSTSTSLVTSTTSSTTTTMPPTTTSTWPPASDDRTAIYDIRAPSTIAAPELSADWAIESFGTSVEERDMIVYVRAVENAQRRILVIGGIHGNEPVTPPTVRGLLAADHPDDLEVWLVPEANPDGVAAGTRWNANEVDLNRNFSWNWWSSDGGPGPISEPETQALTALVERLQPNVVVWVHQPYGYAGSIGPTDQAYEQAWAEGSGLPVRSGVTQHGGAESWTAFIAEVPSMLIEIDSWEATPEVVAAQRGGYEALVAVLN